MKNYREFLMEGVEKSDADVADKIRESAWFKEFAVDALEEYGYNINVFWMRNDKIEFDSNPAKKFVMPLTFNGREFFAKTVALGKDLDEKDLKMYIIRAQQTQDLIGRLNDLVKNHSDKLPVFEDFADAK